MLLLNGALLRRKTTAPIPDPFEVFNEWRFEFIDGSLENLGAADDAILPGGSNNPVWDDANNRYNFTRSNSSLLTIDKTATWTEPFEIWIKFQLKNTSNIQTFFALTNSVVFRINSGQWQVNGQSGSAADTSVHVARIVWNDNASIFQLDNGTENIFDSGGITGGSSNATLGCSFSATNFFDGYIYKLYGKRDGVLASGEVADCWTALGY